MAEQAVVKSVTYTPRVHEPCASRRDCYHACAGRIGGRKRFELHGSPATPEGRAKGGRKCFELHENPGTPEGRAKGGHIGGRKSFELHGSPATPESRAKGGRIGAHNQPREAKVRGGRIGAHNQPREAKVRGGRKRFELHGSPGTPEGRTKGGRKNVESGQLARVARGVESVTEDGIHCDSQTEAIFYGVMTALGGKPTRAASVILPDGSSYTPDFVLGESVLGIPANIPIELKPSRKMFPRFNTTVKKAEIIGAVIVYADELWD